MDADLIEVSKLIRRRNEIATDIAAIIGRPATTGHVGEFIASRIFDIEIEHSAVSKAIDGYFRSGSLAGKSVNVKWYGKQESILDITPNQLPNYYLVMTGPISSAMSSRGRIRPWLIEHVYLFNAERLVADLSERGLKIGIATSVRKIHWQHAEIYPEKSNQELVLTEHQKSMLMLFGKR